jgi:DNA-binding CsgD family transcriptional regulator
VSYLRRKLSVTAGVSILSVANQLSILFEMWMCLTDDTPRGIYLIMGYMVMAGLNMSLVLMAYIRVLPFVLGGLTMTAYGVCCWESGEGALIGMLPILGACFFVIALLGHRLSCNVYRLEHEKAVLKEDERKILDLLELDKSQLMAYISLAREKGLSTEQTETMLDLIGEKARENIRGNVSYYYRQREVDYANLRSFLPELTPSEIEICDLILKEKKLKEILHILGKSEGNITSQRANIRRKLGLDRRANLYDELRKRTRTE